MCAACQQAKERAIRDQAEASRVAADDKIQEGHRALAAFLKAARAGDAPAPIALYATGSRSWARPMAHAWVVGTASCRTGNGPDDQGRTWTSAIAVDAAGKFYGVGRRRKDGYYGFDPKEFRLPESGAFWISVAQGLPTLPAD